MAQLVKTCAGLAIASVKTFNGLAIASAKTIAGLDNTSGGGGSVAFDGEALQTGNAAAATSLTITNKTTAGSNRCGVVSVAWASASDTITGVTWNGVAMTQVVARTESVAANLSCAIWRTRTATEGGEVPTGASSIVISFSGSVSAQAVAHSYNGVDQTTPFSSSNSAPSTGNVASPATVTTTTASTEIVVDSAILTQFDTVPPTVGANQTQMTNQLFASFFFQMASRQAGADGGVMSWTYTGNANWAICAGSLKAA